MASTPLLIGLTITLEGTATANLNATCTNGNTNQSTTKTTASDGKLIFNLGSTVDFSDGWNVGDVISVACIYTSYEQKFSFTIPAQGSEVSIRDSAGVSVGTFIGGNGMSAGTLALASAPSLPSLRYFTGQEFLDYLNMVDKNTDSENGIDMTQLIRIGQGVEAGIDSDTLTKFDSNTGNYYAPSDMEGGASPEYHDQRYSAQSLFWTKFIPIQTLTTFEKNNNGEGQEPDWETLTEAAYNISVHKATGRIKIINSGELPEIGAAQVRITYTFGRSSVPNDIKQLAIIETARRMLGAAFLKGRIKKLDDVVIGDITEFMNFRNRVIKKYKNHTMLVS
ncbi:MAG: hypothetical protein CMH64_01760 [Nanoarchaeota archaeon]|jgi:hypothetical protein|nr:hypothetical protein [Nanoarchaeota archaeon]|tara:strand:+ start:848 stop:1858 length:1011 start_codon:yes stop_codon:yes gene_type:complete